MPEIDPPPARVIVTASEVERVLLRGESALTEAVASEGALPADAARGAAMAAMGSILRELKASERKTGSGRVMVAAQHGPASRLQSMIAESEAGRLELAPLPGGALEAKFDTHDWAGWATVAWAKIRNPFKHPLIFPPHREALPFPEAGRVAILGDWGTGLYGAPIIAETIRRDASAYALLLHLGDVYYAGTSTEVRERFLDVWPRRADTLMRALNSNHEMYSGGHPYFTETLPSFGQEASFFAFQNRHWTLLGLDVAHTDHAIDDGQVAWLEEILAGAGDRRVVLFSHHQLFSHFDAQGTRLWGHARFAAILASRRIFAWYWGHEHRCCIYEERDPRSGLWGRCIGHSGMPESRARTRDLPRAPEHEQADWRRAGPAQKDGQSIPPALILEGANAYFGDEREKFTPHGYATLVFDGPNLVEEIRDCEGRIILRKQLAA